MSRLSPHSSGAPPAIAVTASAEREGTELLLRYEISGNIEALNLPAPTAAPARRDELWRATCFEAFIRPSLSEAYWELNLAPSGDWALYHFTGRRAGMASPESFPPAVDVEAEGNRYLLRASIDLAGFLSPAVPWQLNLTSVIADAGGGRSYWALAHPPEGPPDFHDPACFMLELPPPSAA